MLPARVSPGASETTRPDDGPGGSGGPVEGWQQVYAQLEELGTALAYNPSLRLVQLRRRNARIEHLEDRLIEVQGALA